MKQKQKQQLFRLMLYAIGITSLALGTTISTKTSLGVACITSAPASISTALGWNLSVVVFTIYAGMILAQFMIKGKEKRSLRDLLQFGAAMLFSLYLEWFSGMIDIHPEYFWQKFALLAAATAIIGTGVCLMVNMDLVPNPPDGLVHTISEATHKDMGLIKNIVDTTCVAVALTVDLLSGGKIVTVGFGTVFTMIVTGRIISLVNRLFKKKMRTLAGLEPAGK